MATVTMETWVQIENVWMSFRFSHEDRIDLVVPFRVVVSAA